MKLKKNLLPLTAIAGLIISSSVSFALPVESTKSEKIFLNRVDKERAMDYVGVLSEDIGVRISGTDKEYEAALNISQQFKRLGYNTEVQEFKYMSTSAKTTLKEGKSEISSSYFSYSNFTDKEISGEVVYCGLGKAENLEGIDVKGKIALIQRGESSFYEKSENATKAGAKAVVIYNNSPGALSGTLGIVNDLSPTVGISQDDGNKLVERLNKEEVVNLSLKVEEPGEVISWNVVATMKPWTNGNKKDVNDTNEIVYVTAHYDSVPKAPGANDNASGTAAMLEIAKAMQNMDIDKEIRFIACGSEEVGLRGSRAYVDSLTEEEKSRSVGNFNLDMVATAYEPCTELAVYTNSGKENVVTDAMKKAGGKLKHLSNQSVEYNGDYDGKMGSSDHVPFDNAGIPSALFINVDPSKKDDPRTAIEPYYHKPEDHTGNVSADRLERSIKLAGLAILDTLNVN